MRTLFLSLVIGLVLVTAATADITNGLVAWWKFDETSGTTASDSTGNGHSGVFTNNGYGGNPSWTNGIIDGALSFTVNSAIAVPYSPAFNLTNAITLAFWFYPTTVGLGPPGFSQFFTMYDGYYADWGLRYSDTQEVVLQMTGMNGNSLPGLTAIPTNAWTHVVATFDGQTARLYYNGKLERSDAWDGAMVLYTNPVTLGWFNGFLDDARVYNRALSYSDVVQLFLQTSQYEVDTNADLTNGFAGWWQFNEGSGTLAYDSSGNNFTGTIYSGSTWTNGLFGSALAFDGVNGHVVAGTGGCSELLAVETNMTFSFWVNVTNLTQLATQLSRAYSVNGYEVDWEGEYNQVILSMVHIPLQGVKTIDVQTNVWHHFGFTYNGSLVSSYLDGVLYAYFSWTNSFGCSITPLYMSKAQDGSRPFNGLVEDVRIYTNALSTADMYGLALRDTSGDGIPDIVKQYIGLNPLDFSTDGSGMSDSWEMQYFGQVGVSTNADLTGNGLTTLQDYQFGLNPVVGSTSGDGVSDAWKLQYGFTPGVELPTTCRPTSW